MEFAFTVKCREEHKVKPLMGEQDISDVRKVVKYCCSTPLKKLRQSEIEHIYLELLADVLKNNGYNVRVWYTPGKDVSTKEYRFTEPKRYSDFAELITESFEYYDFRTEGYRPHTMFSVSEALKDKYLRALKEDKLMGFTNILVDGVFMSKSKFIELFTKWRNQ